MKKIGRLRVYNNNDLIIEDNQLEYEFDNDLLAYTDEFGQHSIDLEESIYKKESSDNNMIIDFINNNCYFELINEKEELSFAIDCSIKKENNKIIYIYSFDKDDIKKIEIDLEIS